MKLKIARTAAALTLAAAATFALPLAANAGTYPPADAVSGPAALAPGATATYTTADVFEPGEPVTATLSGENAQSAGLGVVQAVYQTKSAAAANNGGVASIDVTLPANASGTYTLSFTSPSLPAGVSQSITASVTGGGSGTGTGTGLPATGVDSGSLLGLWVGGGALVLAGGAVAVGAAVHRQRKLADA